MARIPRPETLLGRRFEQNGIVWEVARVSTISEAVPHIELFMVRDPTERKIISVHALLEGFDFVPIDEER